MKNLGLFLIGVGIAWGIFALNLETTVSTGGQTIGAGEYAIYVPRTEVNNIGLIETKRTHLMLSSLCVVVGVVLYGFGSVSRRGNDLDACPECAELIQLAARKCRYCGANLAAAQEREVAHEIALAEELGVIHDGGKYYFLSASFDNLQDALRHAKYQASLAKRS